MSQPWPNELIEKIPISTILRLKKMDKREAEIFLKNQSEFVLTAEESELVISIAREPVDTLVKPKGSAYELALKAHRTRAAFIAAAWLSGASWAQIGAYFEIKRQSAMSSAQRFLPPGEESRRHLRISNEPVGLSTIAAWYNWFIEAIDDVEDMSIRQIALQLLTIVDE